ncbi:MAG TPA: glycosyltransferase family 2 protein, partial [Candidatus Nanoarchaeia archaeon]|nr:glycosyltransferase family 2 protein [Candidatus Nanoarchaeia archaeon]
DMSYDPRDFKKILKPIINNEADLVLGNRFAGLKKGSMKLTNKIGNKFLTRLLNKLYKIDIQDSQSGMRAITKKALEKLDLQETGMPLASEMLIEAVKKGLRIAEVPISYNPRIGKAKQNVYNGLRIASTTVRMIRDYNPLTTFSIIASAMIVPGLIIGVDVVIQWLTQGIITRIASVVLSSMLILTGVFTFMIGLMIDLIVKEVRKK